MTTELKRCVDALAALGMSDVQKSARGKHLSPDVARCMAISKASEQQPELTRRILTMEKQAVMRKNFAWLMKGDAAPTGAEFHGAPDEDSLVAELQKLRRREAAIVERIRLGRLRAVDEAEEGAEDDDWLSNFEEA